MIGRNRIEPGMRGALGLLKEVFEKVFDGTGVPVNDQKIIRFRLHGVNRINIPLFINAFHYFELVVFSSIPCEENFVFRI